MKKVFAMVTIISLLFTVSIYGQGETEAVSSASYSNTYVIKNDGSLWGCGGNLVGAGTGYREVVTDFVKILEDVRSVSSGGLSQHVAVKKDDTLWGWGAFEGTPSTASGLRPTLKYPTQFDIDDVRSASASSNIILVIKNDNTLWLSGAIPKGDGTDEDATEGFVQIAEGVIDAFATENNVFYITEDHTLWGYGDNNNAQLGNMTKTGDGSTSKTFYYTAQEIMTDVWMVTADQAANVVMAIRTDNSLNAWGNGGFYTDDYGWIEDAGKPYKVTDGVIDCAVNKTSGAYVKTDNSLWVWGHQFEGGSKTEYPVQVANQVLSVTLGERHASVVKTDNTLWTMGGAYRGALGYASDEVWYTPLTKVFEDVQDRPATWAENEVDKAIGAQLIPEDMQGDYTKPITREEFCILAIRMIEVKAGHDIDWYLDQVGVDIAPEGTFTDCDTKEVRAAKVLGITDGVGDGLFAPDHLLTREQAAKFLTTTALACGREVTLSTPDYSDMDLIAGWAREYTGYVYDINVMRGVGGNRFDPRGSYQRQQAFMTMYRIWQAIDGLNPELVINH